MKIKKKSSYKTLNRHLNASCRFTIAKLTKKTDTCPITGAYAQPVPHLPARRFAFALKSSRIIRPNEAKERKKKRPRRPEDLFLLTTSRQVGESLRGPRNEIRSIRRTTLHLITARLKDKSTHGVRAPNRAPRLCGKKVYLCRIVRASSSPTPSAERQC
ncbi:hypothetical protein EVAR_67899_1 [Eumeta japonica]|uniref:Uncharacterized protein n=1 Tax=Eumeta variegata TaxID=151549 RepID=A0A4C1YWM6_EUMVA|nr:hypothetical protein EVAR_67899_1 [Eumeta japonica]